jgi:hypothetical protein
MDSSSSTRPRSNRNQGLSASLNNADSSSKTTSWCRGGIPTDFSRRGSEIETQSRVAKYKGLGTNVTKAADPRLSPTWSRVGGASQTTEGVENTRRAVSPTRAISTRNLGGIASSQREETNQHRPSRCQGLSASLNSAEPPSTAGSRKSRRSRSPVRTQSNDHQELTTWSRGGISDPFHITTHTEETRRNTVRRSVSPVPTRAGMDHSQSRPTRRRGSAKGLLRMHSQGNLLRSNSSRGLGAATN